MQNSYLIHECNMLIKIYFFIFLHKCNITFLTICFKVKISPGLKKLFAITAVGAITVLFLAHHFKRKRGKKTRKISPWESDHLMFDYAKTSGSEKSRQHFLYEKLMFKESYLILFWK